MRESAVPKYRRQRRASGDLAFVEVSERRIYLSAWDTKQSREEYTRIIAEWESTGRNGPPAEKEDLTVMELAARFWTWAEGYYVRADGSQTREVGNYRTTLKPLKEVYGETLAKDFGPRAFKAIREKLIADGACRHYVNQTTNRLRRIFRWAVSEEFAPRQRVRDVADGLWAQARTEQGAGVGARAARAAGAHRCRSITRLG